MKSVTIEAPAKINLALLVGNRRPDGFHYIWSLMQAVSLSDTLSVSLSGAPQGDQLEVTGPEAAGIDVSSGDNLVLRAVAALRKLHPTLPGLELKLTKRIPVGAGLGGGSSDAAAALKAVNQLAGLNLSAARLAEIGAELGSDVPFFFSSGSAEVTGRGEVFTDVVLPLDYQIVLVTPPERVSTAAAYTLLDRPPTGCEPANYGLTRPSLEGIFSGSGVAGRWFTALEELQNDFEIKFLEVSSLNQGARQGIPAHVASTLARISQGLRGLGAAVVRLSGSGSTVFGIFEEAPSPERLATLGAPGWSLSVSRPVSLGDCGPQ